METVWIVPPGADSAPDAGSGDFLLRRSGELYEVGEVGEGACTWLGSVKASLLPDLPEVQEPQQAPDQPAVLQAVRGVATAEDLRGG